MNIISDTLFTDEKKRLCCLLIEYYPEIFCEIDMLVRQPQVELTEEQKEAKVGKYHHDELVHLLSSGFHFLG